MRTIIHGRNAGTGSIIPIACNTNGELEMTAEIDSSGLAKETTLDSFRTDNASNLGVIATTLDDGTQLARCMGSEDPNDAGATQKQLHLDGSGNVQTNIVNTVNIAPANSVNGHITDDPANSVAVALTGRQTIGTATTQTFLKCDANGVLEVSSSGGGGSSNTNLFPTLNSITTLTDFASGIVNSDYIDLTNARNVLVNCIHTGNATARTNFAQDIAISMEFTDDSTNTTCYSGASTPVFGVGTIQADGNTTGSAVAVLSLGENSNAIGEITGKFGRIAVVNNNNSGTNTAYAIEFKVVISGI